MLVKDYEYNMYLNLTFEGDKNCINYDSLRDLPEFNTPLEWINDTWVTLTKQPSDGYEKRSYYYDIVSKFELRTKRTDKFSAVNPCELWAIRSNRNTTCYIFSENHLIAKFNLKANETYSIHIPICALMFSELCVYTDSHDTQLSCFFHYLDIPQRKVVMDSTLVSFENNCVYHHGRTKVIPKHFYDMSCNIKG